MTLAVTRPVHWVGAGPGGPDLLTLRGADIAVEVVPRIAAGVRRR